MSIRTCALVARYADSRAAESSAILAAHLRSRGVEVLAPDDGAVAPDTPGLALVSESELVVRAELVVAIGGDGTLLYAAGLVAPRGTPLLGVNRGRLGFLTDVSPEAMLESVDAALEGRCEVDRRALLAAEIAGGAVAGQPGQYPQGLALNDVVLQGTESGRLLDFSTTINGRYVNTHGGDGIVIATATGSTAYALSCGGPIVEPGLDAWVVAPICPHTLSDRPIVVSGRSVVEVALVERPECHGHVSCDGRPLGELLPGQKLVVRPSANNITLLHPSGYDYFRLLRSKLNWGRRSFEPPR